MPLRPGLLVAVGEHLTAPIPSQNLAMAARAARRVAQAVAAAVG
jgi:hypothetical protein